jgi:hypothetical protein
MKTVVPALIGWPAILSSLIATRANHQKDGRLSQHATANAIDISTFTFEDGSTASALKDWDKGDNGEFLRAAHRGACRFFNGALSPDYNAAHANHFHFDMGWWKVCR